MAKASGKTLEFKSPKHIDTKVLESFPYEGPNQLVTYETKEFSAVCPFSGLPDVGVVRIEYMPKKKIVELKSLKYYFLSFRDVGIYQEDVTARIYQDLWKFLSPQSLDLTVIYQTRGGIDTTCEIRSQNQ